MALTLGQFTFTLIFGLFVCLLFAIQSKISLGPSLTFTDTPSMQDVHTSSVSSESAHLQGWHSRALAHPHPYPHSITPEDDILELVVFTNSMVRSLALSLVIFRSTANHSGKDNLGGNAGNDQHSYMVVDGLGRVSVLPSTSPDITGILSLARRAVLEFPTVGHWVPESEASCQPVYNVAIALNSEERPEQFEGRAKGNKGYRETKHASIVGYPAVDRMKVQNQGYKYLPDVVRDLFLLVLEADQDDNGVIDRVITEKMIKVTGYELEM